MATAQKATVAALDTAIWSRLFQTSWSALPVRAAEGVLSLGFDKRTIRRIEKLGQQAQAGTLTAAARRELEEYLRVSHILMLMKSEARQAMRRQQGVPADDSGSAPASPRRRRAS